MPSDLAFNRAVHVSRPEATPQVLQTVHEAIDWIYSLPEPIQQKSHWRAALNDLFDADEVPRSEFSEQSLVQRGAGASRGTLAAGLGPSANMLRVCRSQHCNFPRSLAHPSRRFPFRASLRSCFRTLPPRSVKTSMPVAPACVPLVTDRRSPTSKNLARRQAELVTGFQGDSANPARRRNERSQRACAGQVFHRLAPCMSQPSWS